MERLAINGGKPVRSEGFPPALPGGSMIGEEELRELSDVVNDKSPFRHQGLGEKKPGKTNLMEEEARNLLGIKHTLAVSSGTAALSCAMVALKIGIGDEVIMPSLGWYSDYSSVVLAGALPVFAEIDDTLNLDPEDFRQKITPQTKAVIVIHYQGGQARMDEIMSIAREYQIKVVEDCAQCFGGSYRGKKLGTIGDIGITSFQAKKIITSGEGGLLYTNDDRYYVRAVRYHDLGNFRPGFEHNLEDRSVLEQEPPFAGSQLRMSELQSAFILAQLRKLPSILEKCRNHYERIAESVKNSKNFSLRPVEEGHCGITFFMKMSSPDEAAAFNEAMRAEGVFCGPSSACFVLPQREPINTKHMPTKTLPPYGAGFNGEHVNYDTEIQWPKTKVIMSKYVSMGIGPLYTEADIKDMITAIRKVEQGLIAAKAE